MKKLNTETEFFTEEPGRTDTGSYEGFVHTLCQSLITSAGFEKNQIHFKKAADYPPTGSDRLFLICEKYQECREVCGLYIEDMYKNYSDGVSMEQIIGMILAELKKLKESGIMQRAGNLQSYASAKEDLFVRLLNADRHKEELTDAVFRIIGDIALVVYMYVGEIDHCATSLRVHRDTVEKWKKDPDLIFREALANTLSLSPPRIYCWEKMLFNPDYDGESFMDPSSSFYLKRDSAGNCLSTSRRTNGAVAVFLPGVARRLAELMGQSFYMVFTSIHEVMIHNASQVRPEELLEVLRETVKEATPESDFLSLKIYYYDKETGRFSCV